MEDTTEKIKETLKEWISLDDDERKLKQQIALLKERKLKNSEKILEFMRNNKVDNFVLNGNGIGNISRSVRTSKPPLRRNVIKTQLLLEFADQPQKIAAVLRNIEGVDENMSSTGTIKESLIRRIPKLK
jgi:dTDP-D-glucose 4,6-dehydratase